MSQTTRYAEVVNGDNLKVARIEAVMSLRELANSINRPAAFTFIGRLERGVTKRLSPELAYQLLTALEIRPTQMHQYFRFHGIAGAGFRRAA